MKFIMGNEMTIRNGLAKAIDSFLIRNSQSGVTQLEMSYLMSDLVVMSPNSDISDIIFYGERVRNAEEIADEALLREKIYEEGGRLAVEKHIEEEYRAALRNPGTPISERYCAVQILEGMAVKSFQIYVFC